MKITKITNTSLAAQGAPAHHLQCRPRRIHDNANFDAHAICCHWILYGWKGLNWDTFLAFWALQTTYAKHTLWFGNQTPESYPGKWKQFYNPPPTPPPTPPWGLGKNWFLGFRLLWAIFAKDNFLFSRPPERQSTATPTLVINIKDKLGLSCAKLSPA